jgi:NAD(P)H dehydrogenase (quinone)
MKTLVITAHPSSQGKTHKIAQAYKENAEKRGHEVEIIDLYKTEHQLPFLTFEVPREAGIHPNVKIFQDKITASDELVFVHPVWWGNMPAILKNFIDQVFASHYAFKYSPEGRPLGLLGGKSARVIMTAGAPKLFSLFAFALPISPIRVIWTKLILEYCGIKMNSYTVFGGANSKSYTEKDLENFLAKVRLLK